MKTIVLLFSIAACDLPADPHWAVGSWATTNWGGVEIRPDGVVIERSPEGQITDIGRWNALGEDDIVWVLFRTPTQQYGLSRQGDKVFFERDFGYGYTSPRTRVYRGHLPRKFEAYDVFLEEEVVQPVQEGEAAG